MGGQCVLRRKPELINENLIAQCGTAPPPKSLTQKALEATKTTQLLALLLVG